MNHPFTALLSRIDQVVAAFPPERIGEIAEISTSPKSELEALAGRLGAHAVASEGASASAEAWSAPLAVAGLRIAAAALGTHHAVVSGDDLVDLVEMRRWLAVLPAHVVGLAEVAGPEAFEGLGFGGPDRDALLEAFAVGVVVAVVYDDLAATAGDAAHRRAAS